MLRGPGSLPVLVRPPYNVRVKACILRTPGPVDSRPLEFVEVPVPVPGEGEVLLKVSACGICRTDLHVIEGELEKRRSPVIPGHQIVGTVAAVGEGVDDLAIGQRVGVAWLHKTCGVCKYCFSGRENLCERAEFTGWTRLGGLDITTVFVHCGNLSSPPSEYRKHIGVNIFGANFAPAWKS